MPSNLSWNPASLADQALLDGGNTVTWLGRTNDSGDAFYGAPTFSGTDIHATYTGIGPGGQLRHRLIGTMAGVTLSYMRTTTPRYVMGDPDLRGVSRGTRAISGTLVFSVFDRDPILFDMVDNTQLNSLTAQYQDMLAALNVADDTAASTYDENLYRNLMGLRNRLQASITNSQKIKDLVGSQPVRYPDQLRPFDITLTFANEMGDVSQAAIRQIYIVGCGLGWSLADAENDQVYSYLARFYEPMRPLTSGAQPPVDSKDWGKQWGQQ